MDAVSARALEWFKAREAANSFDNSGRLNLGDVMGDKFKVMATNYRRNLDADTCVVLQVSSKSAAPTRNAVTSPDRRGVFLPRQEPSGLP